MTRSSDVRPGHSTPHQAPGAVSWKHSTARHGTGGGSFVQLDANSAGEHETHVRVFRGGQERISPDARLDTVLDFLAHAAAGVPRLIAEIRRLRAEPSRPHGHIVMTTFPLACSTSRYLMASGTSLNG